MPAVPAPQDDSPATVPKGIVATFVEISLHPRRFFASYPNLPTRAGPLIVFAIAWPGVLAGAANSLPVPDSTLKVWFFLLGILFAIPGLYIGAALFHIPIRLLGGRHPLGATRRALAYSAAPGLLGFVPVIGLLADLWMLVVTVIGLARVQRIGLARAAAATVGLNLLAVSITVGLRVYVLEAFRSPSGSMYPTLEVGDHFYVSKSAYGWSGTSPPGLGDVITFEYPDPDPEKPWATFIKRVIALPGDTLVVRGGHPILNGKAVPTCHIGVTSLPAPFPTRPADVFLEVLGNHRYLIALEQGHPEVVQGPYQIPPEEVFVMGDNRWHSLDSRYYLGGLGGGVPFVDIIGRGRVVWYPLDRIGTRLDASPVLPASAAHLAPALERCLQTVGTEGNP